MRSIHGGNLHRLEVNEIPPKETVDMACTKWSVRTVRICGRGRRIVMRVKRGFLWRDGVLRPEEVIAKRCNWKGSNGGVLSCREEISDDIQRVAFLSGLGIRHGICTCEGELNQRFPLIISSLRL